MHSEANSALLSPSSLSPINSGLRSIMTLPKTQICLLLPSIPPPQGPASIISPPDDAAAASLVTPLMLAPLSTSNAVTFFYCFVLFNLSKFLHPTWDLNS